MKPRHSGKLANVKEKEMESSVEIVTEKPCPLCKIEAIPFRFENVTVAGRDVRLGYNHCKKCGLNFVSPRLSDAGLHLLYNATYLNGTVSGKYNTTEEVSHNEYQTFKKYIQKYSAGRQWNLLDIGCGVGNLLETLKDLENVAAEGLEYSEYASNLALSKGLRVKKGDLLQLQYEASSFDCITVMYVLEHVPEPFEVIKRAFSLLRPDGLLMVAVPNLRYLNAVNSIGLLRILTGRNHTLHPQEHLQNFTPKTLVKMVEAAGFSVTYKGMATPLRTGSLFVRVMKGVASFPLTLLHSLGYTVGGIHMVAKKGAVS